MWKRVALMLVVVGTVACKERLTTERARDLAEDYLKTHRGTGVTVTIPPISQELDVETMRDYKVDQVDNVTTATVLVGKLVRSGLLDTRDRPISLPNIAGEYEPLQGVAGTCSYHLRLNPDVRSSYIFVDGRAQYVTSFYRKCDYAQEGRLGGDIKPSGEIVLELPQVLSGTFHTYTFSNGVLRPKDAKDSVSFAGFRRASQDLPPIQLVMHTYSLTNEAKRLGLNPAGGDIGIGEMAVDSVTDLILNGETAATGKAQVICKYTKLRDALAPERVDRESFPVRFGQTPDGKWVVTGTQ